MLAATAANKDGGTCELACEPAKACLEHALLRSSREAFSQMPPPLDLGAPPDGSIVCPVGRLGCLACERRQLDRPGKMPGRLKYST